MVAAQFERTELHDAAVSISHSATSVTSLSAAPVQWSMYTTLTWLYSGCSSTLLVLNMEKYESAQQEIAFLGHHITAEGASPILKHMQALQEFPALQDKKQLQSFMGLVNFYRRFISVAANILLPLTDTLRADWTCMVWAPAIQHSFQLIKKTLTAVTTLTHPDTDAEISLAVDASEVLQQWQSGGGGRAILL